MTDNRKKDLKILLYFIVGFILLGLAYVVWIIFSYRTIG